MFLRYLIFSFPLLFLSGCGSNSNLVRVESKVIPLSSTEYAAIDSSVYSVIEPYRSGMSAKMDEVIAVSEQVLEKGQPEGLLGNFVTDACFNIANQYYYPEDGRQADFCLLNNGGLRASLPAGNITRKNIYELMPFENSLSVLTLKGETLKKLFDCIAAKGGMPVSSLRMGIQNTEAVNIQISSVPFDKEKIYKLITSDYLANGGDGLFLLSDLMKRDNLNLKVRDALLEYISKLNSEGKKLNAQLEGRIVNAP
ncbi:MAG: 5'-nucleotidase C-terminal domain-containing protein [Bacteroidia bacterium]|nr:5'-nucleotidase C-terminal domain-containing protein [Bacteroidia bacterium]